MGSDIRFRELTIWEQYRWLILGTLALLALQTAMIVGLVVQRARRREMREALHENPHEVEWRPDRLQLIFGELGGVPPGFSR